MKKILILVVCGIVLGLGATGAGAQQSASSPVQVETPWARATTGTTGAAYLAITNKGAGPDRLVALKTPVAEKAELHESKVENGVMTMRPIGPLAIERGQSETLKPGGKHVMLMGLKQPLKEGDSFPLTLSFEKAGDVTVAVHVAGPGAMGADAAHDAMPMHDMGGMKMDHGSMK
jgi:periplasmic copper chaperone A